MSSIKRDVKKKAPPRPEAEILSRDPAHLVLLPWRSLAWFPMLVSFSADGDDAIEFERAASKVGDFQRQPWFYPRLVAYGYFWLSERA
jgi:hypothetical protein